MRRAPILLAPILLATIPFAMSACPGVLRAQVYVQEDLNFRNSAFVRVSEQANADLFFADMKVREKSWAEAVNAYQQVLDREDDATVPFGPRVYLSGVEAVRRRLGELPETARERYGELFDKKARDAAAMALRLYDAEALLRVADRYPFTLAAETALHQSVELSFERGSLTGVARAVESLRGRGRLAANDVARYAHLLAQRNDLGSLRDLERNTATLHLQQIVHEGQPTSLGELLDRLRQSAGAIDEASRADRLATSDLRVEILARLPMDERTLAPRPNRDPLGLRPYENPSIGVAVVDDQVWVAGLMGIYQLGTPRSGERPLVSYQAAFGHDSTFLTISARSLEPAVDQGRLYLTLNEAEMSAFGGPPEEVGQLVCVDARQAGQTCFHKRANLMAGEELNGYVFEGPPVIFGDLVIFSGSRVGTNTECSLFALDRLSGRLRWSRFLASASRVSHYDARNRQVQQTRAEPSPVVLKDSVVYCVTNLGVVAAVDALSWTIRWLFKYNRIISDDPDRFTPEARWDTGGWPRSAPILLGDKLVVAPEDSRFLYVLARNPSPEGLLRLNDPVFKEGHRALLGVDRAREWLLFADELTVGNSLGRLFITATNLDGSVVHRTPPFELEERLAGQPLLLGDRLLLPTNKALYRIDLTRDLLIVDLIPVPEPLLRAGATGVFGSLSFEGTRLISVSPDFVLSIAPAP